MSHTYSYDIQVRINVLNVFFPFLYFTFGRQTLEIAPNAGLNTSSNEGGLFESSQKKQLISDSSISLLPS